jgi:hypothetical protein
LHSIYYTCAVCVLHCITKIVKARLDLYCFCHSAHTCDLSMEGIITQCMHRPLTLGACAHADHRCDASRMQPHIQRVAQTCPAMACMLSAHSCATASKVQRSMCGHMAYRALGTKSARSAGDRCTCCAYNGMYPRQTRKTFPRYNSRFFLPYARVHGAQKTCAHRPPREKNKQSSAPRVHRQQEGKRIGATPPRAPHLSAFTSGLEPPTRPAVDRL